MSKSSKQKTKFAVCVRTDESDQLTARMIYEIIPDESAARSNYLRVVDNEGEDYLYPADYFLMLDLPDEIERVLAAVA